MRRNLFSTATTPPIPTEPYLDVVPDMVWIADTTDRDLLVLSNTGWILE